MATRQTYRQILYLASCFQLSFERFPLANNQCVCRLFKARASSLFQQTGKADGVLRNNGFLAGVQRISRTLNPLAFPSFNTAHYRNVGYPLPRQRLFTLIDHDTTLIGDSFPRNFTIVAHAIQPE